MNATTTTPESGVGSTIGVHEHHLGEKPSSGEIQEVLGAAGHEHSRVRRGDGRESIFCPGSDAPSRPAHTTSTRQQREA